MKNLRGTAAFLAQVLLVLDATAADGTQLTRPAVVLDAPAAAYPVASRRYDEQGTVRVRAQVLASGTIGKRTIVSSSGFPRLDAAALEASANARLSPALDSNGEPIDSFVEIPFVFRLEPPVPGNTTHSAPSPTVERSSASVSPPSKELEALVREYYREIQRQVEEFGRQHMPQHDGKIMTGVARVRLTIAADGKLTSAQVVRSSSSAITKHSLWLLRELPQFSPFPEPMARELDTAVVESTLSYSSAGAER